MDPHELILIASDRSRSRSERNRALSDLRQWADRGGFLPFDLRRSDCTTTDRLRTAVAMYNAAIRPINY